GDWLVRLHGEPVAAGNIGRPQVLSAALTEVRNLRDRRATTRTRHDVVLLAGLADRASGGTPLRRHVIAGDGRIGPAVPGSAETIRSRCREGRTIEGPRHMSPEPLDRVRVLRSAAGSTRRRGSLPAGQLVPQRLQSLVRGERALARRGRCLPAEAGRTAGLRRGSGLRGLGLLDLLLVGLPTAVGLRVLRLPRCPLLLVALEPLAGLGLEA